MDLRTLQRYNRFMRMKARSHPGLDRVEATHHKMLAISQRSVSAAEWMADAVHEIRLLARKASNQP